MLAMVLGWSGVSLGLVMLVLMAASEALADVPPTPPQRAGMLPSAAVERVPHAV
jgi:hypothetical protein